MVQRLASSMCPTKYASAAPCRHKMVHPWKCKSYLPTSRAIPGQYFWGFFTFPAFKDSFLGALPPMVGLSFFLASSFPPDIDGLASVAIWANCKVGNDDGKLPVPSSCYASTTLLHISSTPSGTSAVVTGGFTGVGCC